MDLAFVKPLTDHKGPFATLCLDVSRDTEAGSTQVELRVRELADRLAELGAPQGVREEVAQVAAAPTHVAGRVGRLVVADAEGVVADLLLPEPPVRPEAGWGPAPELLPAVRAFADRVAYLLVQVDTAGADVHVVGRFGEHDEESVDGNQEVLHKVPGGGWAHRRLQMRVEDSITRNAHEVADHLARLVREHRPELVLVTGEDKAVAELLDHASGEVSALVHKVAAGSRAQSRGEQDPDLEAVLAEHAAGRRAAVIERFSSAESRQQEAVQGLDAVVAALQQGQVEELLLHDDPSSTLQLWVGGSPTELAVEEAQLHDLGVQRPEQVRADAALVWALAGTDAEITLLAEDEPDLAGGVGALLRWSDRGTPHDAAPAMPGHGQPPGETSSTARD